MRRGWYRPPPTGIVRVRFVSRVLREDEYGVVDVYVAAPVEVGPSASAVTTEALGPEANARFGAAACWAPPPASGGERLVCGHLLPLFAP